MSINGTNTVVNANIENITYGLAATGGQQKKPENPTQGNDDNLTQGHDGGDQTSTTENTTVNSDDPLAFNDLTPDGGSVNTTDPLQNIGTSSTSNNVEKMI
ncbi:hypothetical protein FACS1894176_00670 [Bacteroidia bacterium]|nr:hypothetical protein FACS1894176_00670 [Bacteroidia bacterium]